MTNERRAEQRADPPAALLLVEEINDRVINEFAEAISSLSFMAGSAGAEEQRAIAKAVARLRAHAEAHRALMPPETTSLVDLTDYVATLCTSLAAAYLADQRVRITLTADDIWLSGGTSWRVGLILTELIRNAWRHGLAGQAGTIAVNLADGGATIYCVVADTGRGSQGSVPGRGRRLVQSIAAELGGSVDWRFSPDGSIACLEVPKPQLRTVETPVVGRSLHPVRVSSAGRQEAGRGDPWWPG